MLYPEWGQLTLLCCLNWVFSGVFTTCIALPPFTRLFRDKGSAKNWREPYWLDSLIVGTLYPDPLWIAWSQVSLFLDLSTGTLVGYGVSVSMYLISNMFNMTLCGQCWWSLGPVAVQAAIGGPSVLWQRTVASLSIAWVTHSAAEGGGDGIIFSFLSLFWSHVSIWWYGIIGSTSPSTPLTCLLTKLYFALILIK